MLLETTWYDFPVLKSFLSVQKVLLDLELLGVLDDSDEPLYLVLGQLSSALRDINLCLLADDLGKAASHTSDLGDRVQHLCLSVNVGVHDTQDVREVLGDHKVSHGFFFFLLFSRFVVVRCAVIVVIIMIIMLFFLNSAPFSPSGE